MVSRLLLKPKEDRKINGMSEDLCTRMMMMMMMMMVMMCVIEGNVGVQLAS